MREGADAWFTHTAEELLPAGTRCSCGALDWRKETDILDVWFDSVPRTWLCLIPRCCRARATLALPTCISRAGPQYRGWFHSSLLVGVAVRNVRRTGTCSRTAGRSTPRASDVEIARQYCLPTEVCESWGATCCAVGRVAGLHRRRAHVRQRDDAAFRAYRKLRNTFRFALGQSCDFDPARDSVPDA